MFSRGSRYETVPNAELTTGTGRVVRYKCIRFIPETRAEWLRRLPTATGST